jgi:hypothetical protein
VNKIIEQKKENINADITDYEYEIDNLIFNMYNLKANEIEIIKNK